ncbi:DNA-binding transcriptional response regulator, NtrC family, contains REC, AAA-type ATPase, and a Fis-type DNA-binding domains [Neorhodopirellula lusitana]|uniref:DNA-binding transcriptional response regulator, NtrC family, contains REC, AAA-type ATPase, and a Fis-type DNA-binding domains n=2 Tax=Neorhodopirellula lusitana TaxID=445327 RepID=A0ABY1PUD6_9BACT|nr:DNA-binding transcriptional response regulator, NtrC family, contains REC, AAA-type ATPase, and a Fis-type DNA-binding domains [Neorhodopirellula lusitana]
MCRLSDLGVHHRHTSSLEQAILVLSFGFPVFGPTYPPATVNQSPIPTPQMPANTSGRALGPQLSDHEVLRLRMPLLLGLLSGFSPEALDGKSLPDNGDEPAIRCGIISQVNSRWETVYWAGEESTPEEQTLSHGIASEAVDQDDVVERGEFAAISLFDPADHSVTAAADQEVMPDIRNYALLLSLGGRPAPRPIIRTLAVNIGRFLTLHRDRQNNARQLWQATTMLQHAALWQQLDDDDALLQSVAQCACEVLQCERATIFLVDKARRRLVGRPAIGIAGGVLEVEDDAGIVGEVMQSGEPRWWSTGGIDGNRVNRRIDQAQNFQTRSLLAVPMRNARGQVIGVFEGINANESDHRNGVFNETDVRTLTELAVHATAAIDSQRTRIQLTRSRDRLIDQAEQSNPIIGQHETIRDLRVNAGKVATTDLSVLILGQNGTGKEVLAQHIHYQSDRRNGPFVAVNCAALVESLLESELFGHEKGAFTDASGARQGKFELANGGTLFLDEVGDMSPGGQAKLLRVLEDHLVVRVGGSQPIPVDVRVIAATNQPLQELIAKKRFREDLFFRLNIVSLTLPPLANRGDDIILLAEHFLKHFCEKIGRAVPKLDRSACRAIMSHSWPGNVRELRNTIERLCYLTSGQSVGANDLMLQTAMANGAHGLAGGQHAALGEDDEVNLNEATRLFQVAHIEKAISLCGGNMTEAASTLGLHRSNLYRKMRQLGMSASE